MGLFDALGGKPGKDDKPPEGAAAEDTEELDEESGNILTSLISQLRIGMDLSKVTLPTFVLEPRSMLERITVSSIAALFRRGANVLMAG
jgi:oxysterol-binding protein-related protein 8